MSPKEKAKEILDNYSMLILYKTNIMDELLLSEVQKFIKQCALIAVDEIVELYEFDAIGNLDDMIAIDRLNYWDKVKQEIEKL